MRINVVGCADFDRFDNVINTSAETKEKKKCLCFLFFLVFRAVLPRVRAHTIRFSTKNTRRRADIAYTR